MISTILSSKLLIFSSASSNLLLIPFSVIFISVIMFFSSDSFFYFCLFLEILAVFIHSEYSEHLYDPYFEILFFYCVMLVIISILFSCFSEVLSCSFILYIFLCLLILPDFLCLYVLGRSAVSIDPEGMILRRKHPVGPRILISNCQQNHLLQGCPICGVCVPSCCG